MFFGLFGDMFGFKDSLIRRLGLIVMFDGFGSDPFFGQEFDGRDEKVVVKAPFGFIEIVEQVHDFWILESSVS